MLNAKNPHYVIHTLFAVAIVKNVKVNAHIP